MSLDFGKLNSALLEPSRVSTGARGAGRHFVHLYEDDSSLVVTAETFLSLGLKFGDAVIVLARPNHAAALGKALVSSGIDLESARDDGRYLTLDSEEALAQFMEDGMPVTSRFKEWVGGLIEKAAANGKNVRVFGEMVADLWAQGRIPAAIRVEELWNDLAAGSTFELFCAYPADAFRATELSALSMVCRQHTQVIPPMVSGR